MNNEEQVIGRARKRTDKKSRSFIMPGLIFILIGLVHLIIVSYFYYIDGKRRSEWPSIIATVKECELDLFDSQEYTIILRYEFSVDNTVYRGVAKEYITIRNNYEKYASGIKENYINSSLKVYYDPDNPGNNFTLTRRQPKSTQ